MTFPSIYIPASAGTLTLERHNFLESSQGIQMNALQSDTSTPVRRELANFCDRRELQVGVGQRFANSKAAVIVSTTAPITTPVSTTSDPAKGDGEP